MPLHNRCNLFSEDYDEESATAHVRRLLDILACTISFGPSAAPASSKGGDSNKNVRLTQDAKTTKKSSKSQAINHKQSSPPTSPTSHSQPAAKDASTASVDADGEMNNSCPKLGSFYEFFSLSHVTPPLQCKAPVFFIFIFYFFPLFIFSSFLINLLTYASRKCILAVIRRATTQRNEDDLREDHLFSIEVRCLF